MEVVLQVSPTAPLFLTFSVFLQNPFSSSRNYVQVQLPISSPTVYLLTSYLKTVTDQIAVQYSQY